MKKKILLFILLFIPFIINASEKCTIVSGNGKDIGSEIACGTEHFYIIEEKEDSVRMLAKYNLDIGCEFNKVTINEERYNEIKELCLGGSYCDSMFNEPEFEGYDHKHSFFENEDGTYTYLIFRAIENEEIKQNEKAIGAHGDEKGNPEFPEYGVMNINPATYSLSEYYGNENFADINIDMTNYDFSFPRSGIYYLNDYKQYISKIGYSIINIDMLTVKDLSDVVYRLSKKNLPLDEWGDNDNWIKIDTEYNNRAVFMVGSIKEYLPNGYEWIYGTTYWTKTVKPDGEGNESTYFVDTLGSLCNTDGCYISVGAGLRPVVEISKESINYNLTTESDKGGTLESGKNHTEGETIVLNATAETGYKLEKLIVKTESGTTLEISAEDIIENSDGTISINPDKFVMPLENVVIEAKWAFINPKTGVSSYIGIMFVLLLIGVSAIFIIMNYNKSYEL